MYAKGSANSGVLGRYLRSKAGQQHELQRGLVVGLALDDAGCGRQGPLVEDPSPSQVQPANKTPVFKERKLPSAIDALLDTASR